MSEPEGGASVTVAPRGGMITAARLYHGLIALIGTVTFLTSITLAMTNEGNGGALNGVIFSLSFFTVWSNIIVFIVNWWLAVNPTVDGRYFRWLRLTSLVMITITGLVYAIVLVPIAHPVGIGVYTNAGYHYIVPWATVLGFLVFGPRPRFTAKLVPTLTILPVVWLAYTFIRGLFLVQPSATPPDTTLGAPQHWYPYPFVDVGDPSALIPGANPGGYGTVGINIVVILILGFVFGYLFLGLDRLLSKRQKPTPMAELESAAIAVPESSDASATAGSQQEAGGAATQGPDSPSI